MACNRIDKKGTNRKTIETRKKKSEEKQLYEYFKRQIGKIAQRKTKTWLRKGH